MIWGLWFLFVSETCTFRRNICGRPSIIIVGCLGSEATGPFKMPSWWRLDTTIICEQPTTKKENPCKTKK